MWQTRSERRPARVRGPRAAARPGAPVWWTLTLLLGSAACGPSEVPPEGTCRRHLQFLPPEEFAEELDAPDVRAVRNVTVPVWDRSLPEGRRRKISDMIPGSTALILGEGPEDFRVLNAHDGVIGWVSKRYVRRVLYLRTGGDEPCTP